MHSTQTHGSVNLTPRLISVSLSSSFASYLGSRRLPTGRDRVQVEAELGGDVGPEVLEALPV